MNRKFVIFAGAAFLIVATGYYWLNNNPYGDADFHWSSYPDIGGIEGPRLSYHVSGSPLDMQSEFLPIAKNLCRENAAIFDPALRALNKKRADFFKITFHYGNMFFHYAMFAVENGKVNCDVIYEVPKTAPKAGTPQGT